MRKININAVPETEKKSPKGKYQSFHRNISLALGRDEKSTDPMKRHPFDLAITRVTPGVKRCPYHLHTVEWELYVVISGTGKVRDGEGAITGVSAGDVFLFPPNEAHQIINDGKEDLVYYVIADNPLGDMCHYPDSQKWLVPHGQDRKVLKGSDANYFDGEE
jgi:uncharacterized cupin superfamily protein